MVLASRSGKAAPANRALSDALDKAVAATGGVATMSVELADAGDYEAMRRLLSAHADGLRDGGHIYHTAGILDDGLLRTQTAERFAKVMAPKCDAAQ